MAEMGLLGMPLPEEYGGSGADFLSCVLVMEELMRGCVSTGNTYGAHTILCTESIYRNGNEAQRRRFLPDLIAGRKIGALALTEPGGVSDALSLRCRAGISTGWGISPEIGPSFRLCPCLCLLSAGGFGD